MSKHPMRFKLLESFALSLCLFSAAASSTPVGAITEIVVLENGVGPKSEGCSSFVVTQTQARAFFDRAVLLSGSQRHDFFLHGPCSARGTFKSRYDTWQWEIRNMGTGSITATSGDTFLLGDPAQESSLADE
jgi:hypothetical protein